MDEVCEKEQPSEPQILTNIFIPLKSESNIALTAELPTSEFVKSPDADSPIDLNNTIIEQDSCTNSEEEKTLPPKLLIRTAKITAPKHKNGIDDDQSQNNLSEEIPIKIEPDNILDSLGVPVKDEALSDKTNKVESLEPCNQILTNTSSPLHNELLKDTLVDSSSHENTRKKLRKIKRKDLENIIIEQFGVQILYENELGYQRNLCQRLESTLESANKKALRLSMEVEDLKSVTAKLEKEHLERKQTFILPSQIKRSVGIQCHTQIVCPKCLSTKSKDKQTPPCRPRPKKRKREDMEYDDQRLINPVNSRNHNLNNNISDDLDYQDINQFSYETLTSSYSQCNSSALRTSSILKNGANGMDPLLKKNSKKLQVKFKVEKLERKPSLNPKLQQLPQPTLKVKRKHRSIVLSWDINCKHDVRKLNSFQLYACETDAVNSIQRTWHSIGEVDALELPMMCTLADFKSGCYYHFSVRAIDAKRKRGPFSKPCSVYMP